MSDRLYDKPKGLDFRESCIEWLKGCSNTIDGHPEDCKECTTAFREHIEKLVAGEYEGYLDELVLFIKGVAKFKILGPGIHTYPGRGGDNDDLFDACMELERRGLIERQINEQGHVYWVAK